MALMHESGWGMVLFWAVVVLVFMRVWGWVDGTDRWARKQREANEKALREGWRKWVIDRES